jgi:hypothetical protein
VKLVEIVVDGTKIRPSASKQSFKTGEKIARGRSRGRRAATPRAVFSTTPSLRLPPSGDNLSSPKGTTAL